MGFYYFKKAREKPQPRIKVELEDVKRRPAMWMRGDSLKITYPESYHIKGEYYHPLEDNWLVNETSYEITLSFYEFISWLDEE